MNVFTGSSEYFTLEMSKFFVFQKELIHPNQDSTLPQLQFEQESLAPPQKDLFEKVYGMFTRSFQKAYSKHEFLTVFAKLISKDDTLRKDFICNFRNNKASYHLLAFDSGKLVAFPLFVPAFVNLTEFEVYFIDSGVTSWDKIFFKNDCLLLTDENFLYSFSTSGHQDWEKFDTQIVPNVFKDYLVNIQENNKQQVRDSLSLQWIRGTSQNCKKIPIKGALEKVNDVKILKKRQDEKATVGILKNIKVLQYDNRTYQIVLLKELYFLLEDFSHENKLVSAICDEVNNFLYLCFEAGIVEMFRIELKSIGAVLRRAKDLKPKLDQEVNFELGVKNAIKELFQPLKTFSITMHDQKFLRPLLLNYYNTFNDFNNVKWFSQSDVIKKSKANDILLFHFKYQLNYFNMCFNSFHKYQMNSHSFIQPVTKVFAPQTDGLG